MKPISKMFSITFCILLLTGSFQYGQVKIKERVEINQSTVKNTFRNTNEDYAPILISVGSPSPSFDVSVTGPAGGGSGSGGTGNPLIDIEVPAANGTYYVTVNVFVGAGGTTQANYVASWNDQAITYATHYISNSGNTSDAVIPTTFSFSFNRIPELYDFSISFVDEEICSNGETGLWLTYSANTPEAADKNINISLINENTNAILYDNINGIDLGTLATTTLACVNNLSVRIDTIYAEEGNKYLSISGEAEGMLRSDTLTIINVKEFTEYVIEPWPAEPYETYYGLTEWLSAYSEKGGLCDIPVESLPEEIKYNLVITKGSQYGHIGYMPDGWQITQKGTELYNLDHYYGGIDFVYQAYGEPPSSLDTVVINISTSDPAIKPVDMKLLLQTNPMYAYADPNPVIVGDTSEIVIKHFTESDGLIDFPPEQLFYVEQYEGYEYGTIYSSAMNITGDFFYDTPGEFSFIAADSIASDSVSVMLWIETIIEIVGDGSSSQNLSKTNTKIISEYNNLTRDEIRARLRSKALERRKMHQHDNPEKLLFKKDNVTVKQLDKGSILSNVMSDMEYIYTELEIIVIKKPETVFYVKADFETEALYPGDTVNVIVKKIEEDGNEYDFESSTNFEVGLKDGCGAGYILNSSGQLSEYIQSIQKPILFVVKDSLSEADTLISLRVGVPSIADTVYKPYDEFVLQQALNMAANDNKKSNKQSTREVTEGEYCSIPSFVYSGYGIAEGIIEEKTCEDFECMEDYEHNSPEIIVEKIYTNLYKGKDICKLGAGAGGIFVPLFDRAFRILDEKGDKVGLIDELIGKYNLEACYNNTANNGAGGWQYRVNTEGKNDGNIYVRAIIAYCWDNSDPGMIDNLEELDNIPVVYDDICEALIDFENQKYYPAVGEYPIPQKYTITNALKAHEGVHAKFFQEYISETIREVIPINFFNRQLYQSIWGFLSEMPECSDLYPDRDITVMRGEKRYNDVLNEFINILHQKHIESRRLVWIDEANKWYKENELFTQWSDSHLGTICHYQRELIKIAKSNGIKICKYEKYWDAFEKYRTKM